ncbi:DUF488 domain-containing protein [Rhodovulum sp. PH10]|uniref:DUF488 domain-containing protein n=1 Tax=Rhodovulum sp. PH10 TaxID=1187851 RepID=UPI0006921FA2|nr:DUF488 domain-containing protein [Rhodovulum sp. PH10]
MKASKTTPSIVFTIGYEATDIDRFIATLQAVGVEVLADVRAVAVSRKKGFSKNSLRAQLETAGIGYVHFVGLGDPKPGRDAARAGRYDDFHRIYRRHLAGRPGQAQLGSLLEVMRTNRTCLMCFERDAKYCHRSLILDNLSVEGIQVVHLYGDQPERYAGRFPDLTRGRPGQGAAAAE